jgi:hypothetical protein
MDSETLLTEIQGLPLEEAVVKLKLLGYQVRITKQDGEDFLVFCDVVPSRANLEISNNKVDGLWIG